MLDNYSCINVNTGQYRIVQESVLNKFELTN